MARVDVLHLQSWLEQGPVDLDVPADDYLRTFQTGSDAMRALFAANAREGFP